jgi:hypothetical protein
MVSVGGCAVADDLGVDIRAALAGVFQFFEDHDPRAFTYHKPVAVTVVRGPSSAISLRRARRQRSLD